MTINIQIMCINKIDRFDPHSHITHVGGLNGDGTRWKLEENEAIKYIENGTYSFYVGALSRIPVKVIEFLNGRKYLRTVADGVITNNLLQLPECP